MSIQPILAPSVVVAVIIIGISVPPVIFYYSIERNTMTGEITV